MAAMTNGGTDMRWISLATIAISLAGCVELDDESLGTTSAASSSDGQASAGQALFEHQTFAGNGTTCRTCHSEASGTSAATIGITMPLPANVHIVEQPDARSVTLVRGIPTVVNSALEPVLMLDGREDNLVDQARGAVHAHFDNGREPTDTELGLIASYEGTLFSSDDVRAFADGGPAPELPVAHTDAEARGRTFFERGQRGLCAQCHSGPMLNTTNDLNVVQPGNSRFSTAFVSEFNTAGNPALTYVFDLPDGRTLTMVTPDPGRGLVTGNPCADVATVCNDVTALATFKIPTLHGINATAPYFHDNSAATLEAVVDHYQQYFALTAILDNRPEFFLSDQDKADIVAFLRLL
jgi:cytochrome c peroxidase